MPRDSRTSVLRGIGRFDLVALMINVTIGAGILGLPAKLFELVNLYSLLVLMLCAALVGVIAICFAEVGSRFNDSGGPYLIARTALGPSSGFIIGWLYWISRVLTFATICNLLVAYVARFIPALAGEGLRVAVVCFTVIGVTCIHLIGVRRATMLGNALTALKVALLAAFGVAGFMSFDLASSLDAPAPAIGGLSEALLLAIFAFVGFEAAFVSAGEARNPRGDTPFATATALLVVLVLYLGVQAVCIATVPSLATSTAPLADAASAMWGPGGELVIACGAVVIMLGSLNAGFLATTRLPFAFAEQGDLPPVLARVNARFRTPHIAILGSGAIVLAATLASSFLTAITLATSTRMIVYIAGCVAMIVLRRRADAPQAAFTAPFGRTFAVSAIVLSSLLLASASQRELTQLSIAAASGLMIWFANRLRTQAAG